MTQQMKKYDMLFQQGGHRRTVQRQVILRVLEETGEHLTIEQLLERVQILCPPVNLSTIYRNVELLIDMGLVRANHFSREGTTYELADGKPHVHLVCQQCHAIKHVDPPQLEKLQADVLVAAQFYVVSLALTVAGYCTACWELLSSEKTIKQAE